MPPPPLAPEPTEFPKPCWSWYDCGAGRPSPFAADEAERPGKCWWEGDEVDPYDSVPRLNGG